MEKYKSSVACLIKKVSMLLIVGLITFIVTATGGQGACYAAGGGGGGPVQAVDLADAWQVLGRDLNDLEPEFVAMLPDGSRALVTIQEGSAVAAVYNDGGTWRLAKIFPLTAEAEPDGIAVIGDGKLAVTANEEDQTVSLLDLSGGLSALSVAGTVNVLELLKDEQNLKKSKKGKVDPEGITILSRNSKNYALVTLEKSACLLVLDITDPQNVQKVTLLPVGVSGDEANPADRNAEPEGVTVSPDGSLIAVGNEEEGTVSLIPVLDSGSGIAFGPRVDYDPEGSECEIVSFTPDSRKLLVTNSKEKQVLILDISDLSKVSTIRSVSVSAYGEPTSVAAHPAGKYALVNVVDGGKPTVNPGKVLAVSLLAGSPGEIFQEFTVGQVPDSIAISSDDKWAVVTNEAENDDAVAEDDQIAGSIAVLDLTGVTPPAGGAFTGVKIAVFTDPHYFDPDLLAQRGKAFEDYLASDRKLLAESSAIARAAVDAIKVSDADLVLVPGDLTKDGEKSSHQQFAALLAELEAAGKKVYVINGNHDVNNPHAVKYLGDTTERVDNVSPAEFKDIYREFGSGEAIAADPNSLSYVAEPVPGLRLIAMDSCVYQPEAKCEGAFLPATLSWIKQQVAVARQEGKLAVGFLHHGLIDHFIVQRQLFPEYIVQDADQVAAELAAGGLQVVFTGHFHAQDIVQKQFGENTLYDIETGSLVTYPIPYRIVEIRPDYRLNIATHKIQSINYDLGGQDFPTCARNYLVQGLNSLVPQVVAGILEKQGVPPEQALPQANEKLSTPVAANLTVKDLLVNAMVSHYQGDETIAPQLMPVIQAMVGSTDSLTKMIGQTLLSLGTDPFPTDNTGEIDLTPWYLTIMHTNDTHAHLDDDKALVARRAMAVKQIRGEAPDSLLLDAGDVFSGTLYFTQYQGQADLELMNMLGYDAMALGNHEFDKGPQGLAKFITGSYAGGYQEAASFPLLNANFNFSAEPALKNLAKTTVGEEVYGASLGGAIYPAIIFGVNGEKVGLFGLTTEDTVEISSPGPDIKINDALAAAESAVKTLSDKGINKIIALSHLGWNKDLQLAQQVEGIDVMVGGHSHTKPAEYPTVVTESQHQTPTLVVQAGEYGKYLGRLKVGFSDTGLITSCGGGLLDVTAKDAEGNYTYAVDQAVYNRLMAYKAPLEDLKNTVVGITQVVLNGERDNVRTKETNLGNLIADAMLEKGAPAGAVLAITNGGGIRASIDQGEITLGEALTVMPFGNTLVVLELSGQQIIDALENGVSQVEQKTGRFPQVAGLKFTWDPQKPAGSRIVKVEAKTAGGYQPIDRSAKYLVATNNFLAGGGDGYIVFKAASRVYDMGFVDYEVFKEYLQKHSPVSPQVEGRITEGKAPVPSGGGGSAGPAPAGQLITASGGTITGQGATIVIPAGTVDQDIRVKVEKVTDLSNSPILDKAVLVSAVLNITKDKAGDFKKPVTITMAFEKTKVDLEKQDLGIYWFNDSSKQWNRLENNKVDFVAGKVSGDTLHFTRFAVLAIGKETQKPVETPATVVKDIAGHWAEDIIRQMVAGGIVKGYPDGTFKPESSVTRAEFTAMLVNTLGVTEIGRLPFNDVPDNSWYYPSVAKTYTAGLVKGVSANGFAPQVQITRQEMAAMMVRALGRLDQPVEVGAGEAAQILHAFSDRQEIASWAANDLAAAVKAGLVAGRGDGQVAPAASATRAESIVMIKRMLQKTGKL